MQSPHKESESSPPYTSTLISQIPAMAPNNLDSRVLVNHPFMYRTSPSSFPDPEGRGIDFRNSSAGFFQFDAGLFSGVFSGNDRLILHGLPSEVSGAMPDFLERKRLLQAESSKSHSEAEKRRRERINAHLATLRSLLPNTTKTDKASLLKEVIQHVKDLKRRTSELSSELSLVLPSESNEVNVQAGGVSNDGKTVMKASFSCEDRSDVLPELTNAVKMLRLKMVKAEMATLGGRMRNVLFVVPEEEEKHRSHNSGVGCLKEALIGVVERSLGREGWGGKRQRLNRNIGSW